MLSKMTPRQIETPVIPALNILDFDSHSVGVQPSPGLAMHNAWIFAIAIQPSDAFEVTGIHASSQ